ncbi:hypothetical protein V2J09_013705, partial [Rumex salicifolius]
FVSSDGGAPPSLFSGVTFDQLADKNEVSGLVREDWFGFSSDRRFNGVTVLESEKRAWENSPEALAMKEALNPWRQKDSNYFSDHGSRVYEGLAFDSRVKFTMNWKNIVSLLEVID